MCACRLEATKKSPASSPAASSMDDFFPHLNKKGADGASEPTEEGDEERVYSVLAQRERDLNLAAELGKALLEQNQDLQTKNQSLVEQYSQQIEDLNQEKYEVKLRLERVQDEYELTVRDLQQELSFVREELSARNEGAKKTEAVQSEVLKELTQQNQRLTQQLRKVNNAEESLQKQVESLKRQLSNRRTSLQDHVQQLQVLTDEIQVLSERRSELENRVHHLSSERDALAATLEETQDKLLYTEKQRFEQEKHIRTLQQEKSELEEQNSHLLQRLDAISINSTPSTIEENVSLMAELSGVDQSISLDSLEAVSPDVHRLRVPMFGRNPKKRPADVFIEEAEDSIECDDAGLNMTCMSADSLDVNNPFMRNWSHEGSHQVKEKEHAEEDDGDLMSELFLIHEKLKKLQHQLQPPTDPRLSPLPLSSGQLKDLNSILEQTMESVSCKIKENIPQWSAEDSQALTPSDFNDSQLQMEKAISSLQTELENSRQQLQQVRSGLTTAEQQLRHKDIALGELKEKLRCRDTELKGMRARFDKLQDEAAGLTRDAIVDQARWERDDALKKRNKLEKEMGQVRVELMSLESQLMEAVQQKLALSQQLDLWQADMQELIGSQVAAKMEKDELEEISKKSSNSTWK